MATSTIKARRTLLWTNPNPTSGFASQTITLNKTYDEYEIEYIGYVANNDYRKTIIFSTTKGILDFITGSTGDMSGSIFFFKRLIEKASNGILIGNVYSAGDNTAWSRYTADTGCVPYRIYGIES